MLPQKLIKKLVCNCKCEPGGALVVGAGGHEGGCCWWWCKATPGGEPIVCAYNRHLAHGGSSASVLRCCLQQKLVSVAWHLRLLNVTLGYIIVSRSSVTLVSKRVVAQR